ncbi:MAG TPA: cytochrome c oxidase subunit 3 [Methylomirabilota bacterium]|nr:cytochrome c oxidase subunit 3 [Methylomirabilota bacterium]
MSSTIATPIRSQANALRQDSAQVTLSARRTSSSGIWVGVFAITMSFAAFTSALFVREGTADWGHLVLPPILYVNTLFLLASSGTLELARRNLSGARVSKAGAWVAITLMLGLGFCTGQYRAWLDLRDQGIYLATNPNSSFFYVLTFMHVLHVLAGLLALAYVVYRLSIRQSAIRRSIFENTAVYWHFIALLWVYLLVLCRTKL